MIHWLVWAIFSFVLLFLSLVFSVRGESWAPLVQGGILVAVMWRAVLSARRRIT